MHKIFIYFFTLLFLSFFLPFQTTYAADFTLSIDPTEPTEQQNIIVKYSGVKNKDDCLVIFLKKNNDYLKFIGDTTLESCYKNSQVFQSFRPRKTAGEYALLSQQPGSYQLIVQDYEESCGPGGVRRIFNTCEWKYITSKSVSFAVKAVQSEYSAVLSVDPSTGKAGDKFNASVSVKDNTDSPVAEATVKLAIVNGNQLAEGKTNGEGNYNVDISSEVAKLPKGSYDVVANIQTPSGKSVTATHPLAITKGREEIIKGQPCIGPQCSSSGGIIDTECNTPDHPGIRTAIGCIRTNPGEFTEDFLKFIIGISGGLAFLMMLLGAYQMLASQGNPETLTAGKDRLTNAIIGLLFVIFSVLLMQIIGWDILKLPGFGR